MRIGIDFDNTIANYDGVFHAAALEAGLIPSGVATSKDAVRDHMNANGSKDEFTKLQGHVYGARMDLARVHDGFADFVARTLNNGHELFIVSHKTRHPMLGPNHDMHTAARGFLETNSLVGKDMIAPEDIYFEETKDAKSDRAKALGVAMFIDDLPAVLAMPQYKSMDRVLFDPAGTHEGKTDLPGRRVSRWNDIHPL
ncbi:hypothetical protein [Ahrensia sp. R2A130]|uniref:hypothetical protein n=1 Tax=Ahrensia sp. R2A130 TaxID=744979 RepID=UPI0001E08C35|nr:hypothetical protein [Ahrensia sp. R2A130]EFL89539.1 conserved hypothetical protein [Ahrensia sp. R2A130]